MQIFLAATHNYLNIEKTRMPATFITKAFDCVPQELILFELKSARIIEQLYKYLPLNSMDALWRKCILNLKSQAG